MCIHNSCDSDSLCPCCRKHGRDHDASACTPIQQQLRAEACNIRRLWEGHEPSAWNQGVWHRWMKDMAVVEMLERAAAAIEDARAELASATNKLIEERDEARCLAIAFQVDRWFERGYRNDLKETEWQARARIAKERNWDCFNEDKP